MKKQRGKEGDKGQKQRQEREKNRLRTQKIDER